MSESQDYLAKARESFAGAESELTNGRFNNCARNAYYACFQAAIAALIEAGISPQGPTGLWGHGRIQANFVGHLIQRRKLYPTTLHRTLTDLLGIRHKADYRSPNVSQREAIQVVRRAREFVQEVEARLPPSGEP